jgi:hypothetical protein
MAADTESLQRSLNKFTGKYLRGLGPLRVDGTKGHATNRRIMTAKFYLGYSKTRRDSKLTSEFVRRLRHPHSRKYSTAKMLRTAAARRIRQRAQWRRNKAHSYVTRGVTRYDGKPVAAWLVPYLQWARQHGWRGGLNSGWRDPRYSEQLCYRMCGRPSCPGRCAGRASNHSGSVKPRGAVDVSDYGTFGRLMRSCPHSPRIFNALGQRDPVHFSASGRVVDPFTIGLLAVVVERLF